MDCRRHKPPDTNDRVTVREVPSARCRHGADRTARSLSFKVLWRLCRNVQEMVDVSNTERQRCSHLRSGSKKRFSRKKQEKITRHSGKVTYPYLIPILFLTLIAFLRIRKKACSGSRNNPRCNGDHQLQVPVSALFYRVSSGVIFRPVISVSITDARWGECSPAR